MKLFAVERKYRDGNWNVVLRVPAVSIHEFLNKHKSVAVNPILRVKHIQDANIFPRG